MPVPLLPLFLGVVEALLKPNLVIAARSHSRWLEVYSITVVQLAKPILLGERTGPFFFLFEDSFYQARDPTTLATVNFPFPIEWLLAIFAAQSALTFPSTPECAGIYRNSTSTSSTLKASDAMIPGTINCSALGSLSNLLSEFRN
ncbi:hypothetical protein BofuT4_P048310.1 [Botrytis cinerea T4]|uniref:Secreted protein n=1 Tax=Botryotinia fuckeliana (strain T4) TaxID=999810 RepID=G2XZC6_BOTF4|nr:hypothetical protein BofuT4_P048310.1 [Botrytis cinerea T4]